MPSMIDGKLRTVQVRVARRAFVGCPVAAGVRGDGHGVNGVGVHGNSDFSGIGVLGSGGIAVQAIGTRAGLQLVPTPIRVYDSRAGGNADGPLPGGSQRVVSLAVPTTTPAVPPGATGALISLTLDSTLQSGFLAVFANGIAWPNNSNINWYATGQIVAVTTVTAVDATGKVTVLAGGPGATQFIIDVIGYFH
jgi:hypothetical protein